MIAEPQSPEPRSINRIRLSDFRGYTTADIDVGPQAVVITGDNGAGKTNLLEAISLLSPGRGLRRAGLPEMAREGGSGGFAVSATLGCGDDEPIEIGTGIAPDAPGRRLVRINGAGTSAAGMAEWLSVLWLTPAMDRLFVDAASARRRFLDRLTLALSPAHAQHAQRYEAAMRSRTRLLTGERQPDPDWLTSLEQQMTEHGAMLAEARRETAAALSEELASGTAGPFPRAGLVLADDTDLDRSALADTLMRARAADAAAGRATVGPHRTDLDVTHAAKQQPAARASTGEQKALLLGLVLAHARVVARHTGRRPILLLDEVAAHLDETRRTALFALLEEGGAQVWMTGTDATLFRAIGRGATYIEVAHGQLTRL